ncbi:MAG: hypothetical protein KDC98_22165 [Planctomycetes bacterium]|nr:hypothetical protein [Planctomycetota bacterium]
MRIRSLLLPLLTLPSACSFHSVATHWNGRVGADGYPIYIRTVTNIGMNMAVVVPVLGNTSIDEMVREATDPIAEKNSDHVRVIETSSENYWYGFPPFTWIITPVITNLSVEYRPSSAEIAAVKAAEVAATAGDGGGGEQGSGSAAPR